MLELRPAIASAAAEAREPDEEKRIRESESWGNDELPRLQRVVETAAAMRKSVSAVSKASTAPQPPSALRQLGWRTRPSSASSSVASSRHLPHRRG